MWKDLVSREAIVIALVIVLITILMMFSTRSGRNRVSGGPEVVLLMGPSGSGKTSLFYSWALPGAKNVRTVTSQSLNRSTFKDKCEYEVIDCPGHPKLRVMGLKFIPRAKYIVYLIDGSDAESIKGASEYVYDIFVTKGLRPTTKMLLCRNKTDVPQSMTNERMVELMNGEIEKLRTSRAQELEGDNALDNYIGVEGEVFDILKHAPIDVQVGSASVKKGQISEVESFLHSHH